MSRERTNISVDEKLLCLLEKQKRELVVRSLRQHEEVKSEKAFTDKIIASLSDIMIVLDNRMQIIKANKEFVKCLGYDMDNSKKIRLKQLVAPDALSGLRQHILAGDFNNHEVELISKSGRKFLASINGSKIEAAGKNKIMYVLIAKDKTEVYDMMSRVKESQMQLIHSGRLASLGEMAAGIAHELTQPLNAILLFARNSLRAISDQGIKNDLIEENLTFIVDRVKKASSIIKSLKSFARKAEEEKISMDVNSLIRDILRFLDAQLKLSDVVVELNLGENITSVMAHNVRLEQVFLNIIQNALQAMGKIDNPRLIIRTSLEETLDPEKLKSRNYVVISITDNGEGMSPEVKTRIFDPFFTTREVGSGMGLGLSIVDRIIREHSGFIKVDSSPDHGSCFTIYLPSTEEKTPDNA